MPSKAAITGLDVSRDSIQLIFLYQPNSWGTAQPKRWILSSCLISPVLSKVVITNNLPNALPKSLLG